MSGVIGNTGCITSLLSGFLYMSYSIPYNELLAAGCFLDEGRLYATVMTCISKGDTEKSVIKSIHANMVL